MRLADVQIDVLDIRVDALNRLVLFLDHSSELLKHSAQFNDCLLNCLHGSCSFAQKTLLNNSRSGFKTGLLKGLNYRLDVLLG